MIGDDVRIYLESRIPELWDQVLHEMRDPAIDDKLAWLELDIRSGDKAMALERLGQIEEAIALMRQRYADQALVRAGHIMREALTAEQYMEAQAKARREHPEAWKLVLPTKEVAEAAAAILAAQNVAEGKKEGKNK